MHNCINVTMCICRHRYVWLTICVSVYIYICVYRYQNRTTNVQHANIRKYTHARLGARIYGLHIQMDMRVRLDIHSTM